MIFSDKGKIVFYSYHRIQKQTNTSVDVLIVFLIIYKNIYMTGIEFETTKVFEIHCYISI
jgi:hypothetical protein